MSRAARYVPAQTPYPQRGTAPGKTPGGIASLRPFRYRGFTLLWTAGLISTVGSWMQTVAVGALVVSNTGKATWAVLVAAGAFLPTGLLSPVGGALADRLPRRPVLVVGNLAAAVTAVLLAAAVASGHDSPAGLVALVTLQGSASALIGRSSRPSCRTWCRTRSSSRPSPSTRPSSTSAASSARRWPAPRWPLSGTRWRSWRTRCPSGGRGRARVRAPRAARRAVGRVARLAVVRLQAARGEPSCRAAIGTIAVVALLGSPFIAWSRDGASPDPRRFRAVAQTTALLTTAQGAGAVAGALCLAPLAYRLGRGRVLAWSLALLRWCWLATAARGGHGRGGRDLRCRPGVPGSPVGALDGRPAPGPEAYRGRYSRSSWWRSGSATRSARSSRTRHRPDRNGLDHRGSGRPAIAHHGGRGVLMARHRASDHQRVG